MAWRPRASVRAGSGGCIGTGTPPGSRHMGSDAVGTAQGVFEVAEGGDPFEGGHGDGPGSGAGGYRMMRTAPRGDGGEAVEPVAENGRPRAQVALGHLGDLALAEALDAAQLDAHGLARRRRTASWNGGAEVGMISTRPVSGNLAALEHGLRFCLIFQAVWTPSRRPSSDWVM